jgi:membrane associated rhomboid family serine protease
MGIQDRDYYREGPSFLARLAGNGKVTLWLVGINVALFVARFLTKEIDQSLQQWLTLDVDKLFAGQVWRLLTYSFMHAGVWHLAGNMLFLWWFGRQVEDDLGPREYLIFYLVSAVLAGIAFVGIDLLVVNTRLSPVSGAVVGASGAVMAVLLVAACTNPRQTIYLFFLVPVPIWLLIVVYLLIDAHGLLQLLQGGGSGGVAVACHLGGAAFGFLYHRNHWRLSGLTNWLRLPGRARPRLRLYREEEIALPPRPAPTGPRLPAQQAASSSVTESAAPGRTVPRLEDEHLEAKVDDILAKVSRVGVEGLTDHERQTLLRASEAIKRRRG